MSGNPTLNENTFQRVDARQGGVMTVQGSVNKTTILLGILLATGYYAWNAVGTVAPYLMAGMIGGLVLALVTCFKPQWSMVTAPLYAAAEGLVLGAISRILETRYEGIALQAALLTAATLAAMLGAYTTGLLRATETFKRTIVAATFGIVGFYLITWVLQLCGVNVSFLRDSSPLSIGISLVVVAIAAFNLIIDFDVIEQGANVGAPKYMEWYAAFGLLVTLVWLYVELLRLLAKLRDR